MFTKIPERFRSRVLIGPVATASSPKGYALPTPGAMGITLRCIMAKGNAARTTLSLKTGTAAAGGTEAAYPVNVPIYVDGVRDDDAKGYTFGTDADGTGYIVDFCIDPATVPEGKYIGIATGTGNAANLISVEMIEDVAYKPTPAADPA